jgi:amino acid transporter
LAISTFFWYVAVLFGIALFVSRYLMAVAFDRVLPSSVAYVSERFHTPVVAQLISLVVTLTGVAIITLTPLRGAFWFATDTANLMAILLGFMVVALAVIAANARNASSLKANRWVLIAAAVFDVAILGTYCAYMLAYSPLYLGVQVNALSIVLLTSPFIAGIIIYYAMRSYRRKREGLDLDNTFRVIPPE